MIKITPIILAAGKGTRMKTNLPKILHKVCGVTMLEKTIAACLETNSTEIENLRLVVSPDYSHIEEVLAISEYLINKFGSKSHALTEYAVQQEQLGTGHAVLTALEGYEYLNDEFFLILPADTPLICSEPLSFLVDKAIKSSADVSVLSFIADDPTGFGRIIRNDKGDFIKIVEQKEGSPKELEVQEVNSSFYLVKGELLKNLVEGIENNNKSGEFYLTDIIEKGVSNGSTVCAFTYQNPDQIQGANTISQLTDLERRRRAQINEQLMDEGVRFEDPERTYIDEGVKIGPDSFIGAGTRIQGFSQIGRSVTIEGDSLISNSNIGDHTYLKLGCYINESNIQSNCTIGPFAQIRPGAILANDVKIGNFVEVKKSKLEQGAKVNHLSYIGDASVGAGSNIGAGTITCNYDGERKHITTIGEEVFLGSNSILVAPVKIEDGAYVGAGSVITKDVSEDSLAIARSRQTEIKDWVTKKKKNKK